MLVLVWTNEHSYRQINISLCPAVPCHLTSTQTYRETKTKRTPGNQVQEQTYRETCQGATELGNRVWSEMWKRALRAMSSRSNDVRLFMIGCIDIVNRALTGPGAQGRAERSRPLPVPAPILKYGQICIPAATNLYTGSNYSQWRRAGELRIRRLT